MQLNDTCQSDEQCHDKSLICKKHENSTEKICTCKDGYYENDKQNWCLLKGSVLNKKNYFKLILVFMQINFLQLNMVQFVMKIKSAIHHIVKINYVNVKKAK